MPNNIKDRIEFLWKVISRYDQYYSETNSKAAVLLAFNTFILGTIIIKFDEIWKVFDDYCLTIFIANICLLIILLATIISTWKVIKGIYPFLDSPQHPEDYNSNIFFGHVNNYKNEIDYKNKLDNFSLENLNQDLAFQAYILAKGLTKKFNFFKSAFKANLWQMAALLALGLTKTLITIFENLPF